LGLIGLIAGELVLSGILARERFGSAGVSDFSELDSGALGATTESNAIQIPDSMGGSRKDSFISNQPAGAK
jgi:hypothetical protein